MTARNLPPLKTLLVDPRLALMLALGFSSGLPFLLIFSTQSVWLREAGVSRSAIGLMSYAALAFAFKFAWAPIIDRFDPPGLGAWLGRRRGWMLAAQLGVAARLGRSRFRRSRPGADLERRLRLPHRLRRRHPGRDDRRLAHRRRAAGAAGHDGGDLPARLSAGDAVRRRRRPLHRRFRQLARRLSRHVGPDGGGDRRLPAVAAARLSGARGCGEDRGVRRTARRPRPSLRRDAGGHLGAGGDLPPARLRLRRHG